jgi:hypothetical protein
MNAKVMIPRERTYKLPEGHYHAKVQGAAIKAAKNSDTSNCVIHFSDVQVRGLDRWDCCARAIFPLDLSAGSHLRCFLEGLLGSQFFIDHAGQPLDLDAVLRGMECEINVVHGKHDESKFDWPMVLVVAAHPARDVNITTKEAKD